MQYVFFTGRNRVGKTTLSLALHQYLISNGSDVEIVSFAEAMRYEIVEYYGIPYDVIFDKSIDKNTYMITLGDYPYLNEAVELHISSGLTDNEDTFKSTTYTLRELLITHGTHIRRKDDNDYWVKLFSHHAMVLAERGVDMMIVDDARYQNEFDTIATCDLIFWLDNGFTGTSDLPQDNVVAWYRANRDRCISMDIPIPLSPSKCDIILQDVIKHIGDRT